MMTPDQPHDHEEHDAEGGEELQDASRDGFVSIWIAPEITEQEVDDYLAEVEDFDPDGENEEAFSRFAEEFGLLWYDHDFMEAAFENAPAPVGRLLEGASFSESFLSEAAEAAKKASLTTAQAAILLYDVAYATDHGAASGERFQFLGSFPYIADEEDE
jgi:immunity protein 22 of polymorphic toxin system